MRIGIIIKGDSVDPFTSAYSTGTLFTRDDEILVRELVNRQHQITPIRWDSDIEGFVGYDLLLIRSPWDFLFQLERFKSWLIECENRKYPLWNPPSVIFNNLSKKYLITLAEAGILTIPTQIIRNEQEINEIQFIESREIVLKPAISAGAAGAVKCLASDRETILLEAKKILLYGELIIQPFYPEISTHGEWSLIFFGGTFSHAVRKVPAYGEFREQAYFGGSVIRDTPGPKIIKQANDAHKAIHKKTLPYCRVDGIEKDGDLYINEVELIDPRLFFVTDLSAAGRFADVIEGLMKSDSL